MQRWSRRRRLLSALVLGVAVLGLLYAWDGSRQPVSGNGWTILLAQRGLGTPNTVGLIADQAALDAAWDAFRARGSAPRVNFDRLLVLQLIDSGAIACRSRLDGISVDRERRLVSGSFSRGLVAGCDDGIVPDSFLVAVDRGMLPVAPWTLLLRDPPPADAPDARLEVSE
jgi:hypothetical protein